MRSRLTFAQEPLKNKLVFAHTEGKKPCNFKNQKQPAKKNELASASAWCFDVGAFAAPAEQLAGQRFAQGQRAQMLQKRFIWVSHKESAFAYLRASFVSCLLCVCSASSAQSTGSPWSPYPVSRSSTAPSSEQTAKSSAGPRYSLLILPSASEEIRPPLKPLRTDSLNCFNLHPARLQLH